MLFLDEHVKKVNDAIAAMEEQAELEILSRVREFSKRFPNRVVTVLGGMGSLTVSLGRKVNAHAAIIERPYRWQSAGKTYYVLSHGEGNFTEYDAPRFMEKYRDELYGPMEDAEAECGILYTNAPMVACGLVEYQNGERL